MVLGREWLHSLGPTLKRSYEHNSFMFEVNGTHVLLLGEKNVPSSPLICTAELLSSFDEIEQVFLCYSLCHLLSNSCFEVTYDEHGDKNKCDQLKGSSSTSHTLSSTLLFQQKTNLTSNVTLLTSKETPYVHNLLCHTYNVTNINDSSPCMVVRPQMSSNVMNIVEEVRP